MSAAHNRAGLAGLGIVWIAATLFCFRGLFIVNPNQAQVLQLFGSYVGTVRETGVHFVNPFYSSAGKLSLRIRNFESNHLKVNDHDGNPIEIAAIVVWRVVDTAEACSTSTTTRNTSTCKPKRRCATWPRCIPTTPIRTTSFRCAATRTRSPAT